MKTKVSDRYKDKKRAFVQTRSINQQTEEVGPTPYENYAKSTVLTMDKMERPKF